MQREGTGTTLNALTMLSNGPSESCVAAQSVKAPASPKARRSSPSAPFATCATDVAFCSARSKQPVGSCRRKIATAPLLAGTIRVPTKPGTAQAPSSARRLTGGATVYAVLTVDTALKNQFGAPPMIRLFKG